MHPFQFTGEYLHTLDNKGRLAIPARFRPALADGLILTRGLTGEPCLQIYPPPVWLQLAEKVNKLPLGQPKSRKLRRLFFASAVETQLDSNGRILIPLSLRLYAGMDEQPEVVVLGVGDWVELWAQERWASYQVEGSGGDLDEALALLDQIRAELNLNSF